MLRTNWKRRNGAVGAAKDEGDCLVQNTNDECTIARAYVYISSSSSSSLCFIISLSYHYYSV